MKAVSVLVCLLEEGVFISFKYCCANAKFSSSDLFIKLPFIVAKGPLGITSSLIFIASLVFQYLKNQHFL